MKKFSALILSLVLLLTLCACGKKDGDSTSSVASDSTAFVKPTSYSAVLSMKINPQFKIYLDSGNYVLALEALNKDATTVKQSMKASVADIKSVTKSILTAAKKEGFLKENIEIDLEITELNNTELNEADILKEAATAVESAASGLGITVSVNTHK